MSRATGRRLERDLVCLAWLGLAWPACTMHHSTTTHASVQRISTVKYWQDPHSAPVPNLWKIRRQNVHYNYNFCLNFWPIFVFPSTADFQFLRLRNLQSLQSHPINILFQELLLWIGLAHSPIWRSLLLVWQIDFYGKGRLCAWSLSGSVSERRILKLIYNS